jgi:hypothetical protein
MALFTHPKSEAVSTNPKLGLQNGIGTKFSHLKLGEGKKKKLRDLKSIKNYTFFMWSFSWYHKIWTHNNGES